MCEFCGVGGECGVCGGGDVELPEYPGVFEVTGFERRRNYERGPVLTLAIATQTIPGIRGPMVVRDVVTMMRLADLTSDRHELPVNRDRYYGPRGRRCPVGRTI